MFTIVVYGGEKGMPVYEACGFVKCVCGQSFSFDLKENENTHRHDGVQDLICPHCKYTSNEVLVPPYTDEHGNLIGERELKMVYRADARISGS